MSAGVGLLKSSEVPSYALRQHVISGYRPLVPPDGSGSLFLRAAHDLFRLHNETFNVWSHAMGGCYSVLRLISVARTSAPTYPAFLRPAALLFEAGAICCFAASSIAHLLAGVLSRRASALLWAIDSLGIVVNIGGSYLPGLTYAFRCQRGAMQVYICIVATLLLASVLLSVLADPASVATKGRGLAERGRVAALCATVVFGLVPLCHFCAVASPAEVAFFLPPVLAMFVCYGLGLAFFLSSFPECVRPVKFDLTGGSHLIWHLFVLAAVVVYDGAVAEMLRRGNEMYLSGNGQALCS